MLRKRRFLSALLSLVLILGTIPITAMAEQTESEGTGLCEHHPQHTAECGYTEGTAGTPCSHEHTGDCYTLVTNCVHEHTDECYPAGGVSAGTATPSEAEEQEPTECTHVCSEESGCITAVLDCKHEHDEACGYAPATQGTPCTYVCEICNPQDSGETEGAGTEEEPATPGGAIDSAAADVQALIDALPTAEELERMSQDEQAAVYEQVQAAYNAYTALTDEEKELITGADIFDDLFAVFNGMTNALATASGVTYLDENGEQQTVNDVIVVDNTVTTWTDGWYVVKDSVSIETTINVSGDAKLILADDSALTINCASGNAILVSENASLTIYAQSKTENAGVLTANSSKDKTPGIKSNGGALTVVGAKVNSSYISFTDTNFTIKNGATVTVNGLDTNLQGISYTNGTMEIIDSAVSVTHYRNNTGTGIYGNQKINTSGPKGTLIIRGNSKLDVKSDRLGLDIEVLEVYGGEVDVQVETATVFNGAIDAYDITVSGGSLTAETEVDSNATGAITAAAFYMTGGVRSITVTGGKLTGIATGPSYAESIDGSGTVDLHISGGEVYLEATADKYSAYGARIKRYTITGGSCTCIANSKQSQTESSGLFANSYNIAGGTTTTIGDGWAFYQQYKPTVSESFRHVTYGNEAKSADGAKIVDETQSDFDWNNYKYIRIEPKPKQDQTGVPGAPTQKSVTSNSVTLYAVTGTGQGDVQYGYTTGTETADAIANWQTSTTFTGLSAGTDYTFYTRYAGNEEYNPSGPSANGLTVTTLPDITTTSLGEWYVGVENSVQLTASVASGKTVTWALATGSTLPTGLTLSENGTISGTPSVTAASHSFTVQATISGGADGNQKVSNTAILTITINQGTPVITATSYNGDNQTDTFTYGDTITVSGKIAASATAPSASNGISMLAEPEQNQVGLYVSENETPIATAQVTNGSFTITYNTSGKDIPIRSNQTLTVKYGGSSDLISGSTTVQITLNKKSVTAQVQGDITKVYDGDTDADVSLAVAAGDLVNSTDAITVTGTGTYASPNVDTGITVTVSNIQTSGNDNGWYTVSAPNNVTGSITQSSSKLKVEPSSTSLTYGGTLEITVTVQDENENTFTGATGTVTLSNDNKTLATSDNPTDGVYTLTYNTTGKGLFVDSNDLTVSYNGDKNLQSSSTTAAVSLSRKSVSATIGGTMTKTYDGTVTAPSSLTISLSSVEPGDNVIAIGIATYNSANVSDADTITVSGISLAGTHAGYYTLSSTEVSTPGSITAADIDGSVSISGTPVYGGILTATYEGNADSVIYQWCRDDEEISDATGETYTLTMEDVGAAITVQATAADTNHTGSVTSNPPTTVGPAYTVTIPEKVDLGGTVTISASDVNVASGQQLAVEITGTSGDNDAFTLTSQEGAEITYTVTAGNDLVSLNSTVLTVNGGEANAKGETSLTFVKPDEEKIPFSGTYTGTMTFTIRTREVSGS